MEAVFLVSHVSYMLFFFLCINMPRIVSQLLNVVLNLLLRIILLHFAYYSKLSLTWILNILNFALSGTTYPAKICWYIINSLSISRIFVYVWQIFWSLKKIFSLSRTFPKIFTTFCNFLLKLASFQLPLGQLLQLYWQEWVKTLK